MCCCHLACCYKSVPVYLAVIALIECILGIIRIAIFFSPSSLLINNDKAIVGFILDWISCIAPTFMGLLVALTILIVLCAVLSHMGNSNKVRPVREESTGDSLKKLWKSRPLQRLIQLNCNCPCYIARPKLRFVIRLLFLLVCFIFRLIAIGLYATAGNGTSGNSLSAVCGMSLTCLVLTFLIDLYQYSVWWHYRPQCDTKCSMLSSKHKRYIPYHLMGYNRTMRLGDKPCPDGYWCNNRRLEHILIFHSFDYKPQPRYCDVRQKIVI